MIVKIISGCMAGDIIIDGVSVDNMPAEKFSKIVKDLIFSHSFRCTFELTEKEIFKAIMSVYAPIEEDNESEPCEICGETVTWRVYNY